MHLKHFITYRVIMLIKLVNIALICLLTTSLSQATEIVILGVAQDAGYPQAGCYEPHCMPGWQDPKLRRGATSVALIEPGSGKKYLFEATPHLQSQLYILEQEAGFILAERQRDIAGRANSVGCSGVVSRQPSGMFPGL